MSFLRRPNWMSDEFFSRQWVASISHEETKKRFFSLVSRELNWLSSHQQSSVDIDNREMKFNDRIVKYVDQHHFNECKHSSIHLSGKNVFFVRSTTIATGYVEHRERKRDRMTSKSLSSFRFACHIDTQQTEFKRHERRTLPKKTFVYSVTFSFY